MKFRTASFYVPLILFTLFSNDIQAQNITATDQKYDSTSFFHNTTIGGQWFMAYQYGESSTDTINSFTIKRATLTVKQKISKIFEARFTQDITLDNEGSDAGNIEMRLKYCYLKTNLPDAGFITSPNIEFGLVHRPWVDFEEKINRYRVQGALFLDRNKIISSADFGVTLGGLLGGKLESKSDKKINYAYPGKYGSFSIGVYNGGGYFATEKNLNKIIEGRLTIRPLPNVLPGLQFSYLQSYGKGNLVSSPDYINSLGALSFESNYFNAIAQYYQGKGNYLGDYVDSLGQSTKNNGYSFFLELKIPKTKASLIGRYDDFTQNLYGNKVSKRYIAGISYFFFENSKIILDVDYLKKTGSPDCWLGEVAVEVCF
ncbi:MAG: hypothetical protein CVU05_10835 [Bacteroidetes bacterium HGW-Bacteroidetes-21]|jgi:hypothetical protein|nr:MAG: hypothetical protein CVU05_10835 [Bacteroidetes bacterium HGW-Bacteroidetes-21]